MSSTSSTTSATSTATSSPTAPPNNNQSSNLYLFTFVATLFILLTISSTIIFRSYLLRRRYQRRMQEALAAGVILAPREQGSRRKRFRTRPKFYDVWLDPAGDGWDEIQPVSVMPVKTKRRKKQATAPAQVRPEPSRRNLQERFLNAVRLHRGQSQGTTPTSPVTEETMPTPSDIMPLSPTTPDIDLEKMNTVSPSAPAPAHIHLQVAVLVEMPKPRNMPPQDDAVLPEILFGVTRLPCKSAPSE